MQKPNIDNKPKVNIKDIKFAFSHRREIVVITDKDIFVVTDAQDLKNLTK